MDQRYSTSPDDPYDQATDPRYPVQVHEDDGPGALAAVAACLALVAAVILGAAAGANHSALLTLAAVAALLVSVVLVMALWVRGRR